MSGPPLQLHVRFNVRFVTIAISAQLKAKQKNKMDRLGSENTTFVNREKALLYIVFLQKWVILNILIVYFRSLQKI